MKRMFSNKTNSNSRGSKTWLMVAWGVAIFFGVFMVVDYVGHKYCRYAYKFITTECSDPVIDKRAYLGLKVSLEEYFASEIDKGNLSEASVYFRDLNRGPVMGINETALFSSASLLKIPVVIAVLKTAEEKPEILNIQLVNEGKINDGVSQFFVPSEKIQNNVPYTIREVIRYALSYSDNTAISMLHEFITIENDEKNSLSVVFKELGLVLPEDLLDRDVSTRGYASLFRLIYNASYLSAEYSEMIMEDLSKSHFEIGLRGGVPLDVVVANKFGERFWDDGTKQLHDCGVVYYPENPYLLCIMTRGNDYNQLAKIIREISEKVYKEVDSRKL